MLKKVVSKDDEKGVRKSSEEGLHSATFSATLSNLTTGGSQFTIRDIQRSERAKKPTSEALDSLSM